MNESSQQCLVCLEDSAINIKTISLLLKICECNYWVHENCINAWLIKEPVCPICKKQMIYETKEVASASASTSTSTHNHNVSTINSNDEFNYNKIIFKKTLLFCILTLTIVIIVILMLV